MREPSGFSGVLEGGQRLRGWEGEYDDVDGGLKGNERGMMQAWVRIVAKAGDGLYRRTEKKGTKG